jgi:flagellar biosynthesis component FlhA
MAQARSLSSAERGARWGLALSGALTCVLIALPNPLLDVGVALSWTLSVGFLSLALSAPPLSLTRLPQWLLLLTVGRLCLNIATTRAILSEARAGGVVRGLGELMMGEAWLVGVSFFVALLIIQLTVISRGAERIAEVSARFALDALPGAQQALLHALERGEMHPEEARRAREALQARAELCGALDGAMRFVKGDAYASLSLVCVNVFGGALIGVVHHNLTWSSSWARYAPLTLGDGLVAQLPALLSALAVAGLVARLPSEREGERPYEERQRALGEALQVAWVASVVSLCLLSLAPLWSLETHLTLGMLSLSAVAISLWGARSTHRGLSPFSLLSSLSHLSINSAHRSHQDTPHLHLLIHPQALDAVGGASEVIEAWAGLCQSLGLPQRPLRVTSDQAQAEASFALSVRLSSSLILCEGVALPHRYATFTSAPPEGAMSVTHPLWGLEGWWRDREGGWSERCEPYALSALEHLILSCYAGLARQPELLWSLDELWAHLSAAPASLKSAALRPSLDSVTLLSLARTLSAQGSSLSDPSPLLEGLARALSEGGTLGETAHESALSEERLLERVRRTLGWRRVHALHLSQHLSQVGTLSGSDTKEELGYVLIELSTELTWGEEERALVMQALRDACEQGGAWVLLCAPERYEGLARELSVIAPCLPLLSWSELPPSLPLEQLAWVG